MGTGQQYAGMSDSEALCTVLLCLRTLSSERVYSDTCKQLLHSSTASATEYA